MIKNRNQDDLVEIPEFKKTLKIEVEVFSSTSILKGSGTIEVASVIEKINENKLKYEDITNSVLKNNKSVIFASCLHDDAILKKIPFHLTKDKDFIRQLVQFNGRIILCATKEFKNDREIVLEAVKNNGYTIQFVSGKFRNDPEIVLHSIVQNPKAFLLVNSNLSNDYDFALESVLRNGKVLKFIHGRQYYSKIKHFHDIHLIAYRIRNSKIEQLKNVCFLFNWMKRREILLI